jgi:hypothetical protein
MLGGTGDFVACLGKIKTCRPMKGPKRFQRRVNYIYIVSAPIMTIICTLQVQVDIWDNGMLSRE